MSIHCINCQTKIPLERLELIKNTSRCARCQEKYELGNPGSITRKAPENPIGSREDFKKMSGRSWAESKKDKTS